MIWSTEQEKDSIGEMIAATASHLVFQVLDAANAYRSDAGGWTFSDANHPPAADPIEALTPVFNELAKTIELLRKADFQLSVDAAFKVLLEEADPQICRNLGLQQKKTN